MIIGVLQADEWKEKGNVLMKEEKFVEAMLNYTQAVKIDPDNPTYYSNRSLAFLKMQQYFLALEDANEVIRRMPKWTKVGSPIDVLRLDINIKFETNDIDLQSIKDFTMGC